MLNKIKSVTDKIAGKIKFNKNLFLAAVAVLAVVFVVALILNVNQVSPKAVAEKSVNYLNKNILQGGQTAKLVSFSEENGLIKMKLDVGGQSYDSYATKDGKLFFPQGIDLTSSQSAQANKNSQTAQGSADISKVKIAGEPFTGNVNAPVTVALWTDYQCPFCQKVEAEVVPQIVKDYVNGGKVKIVFKDYPFLGNDSQTLGKFGRAVWEVAPDKFYQWHKAIFENQGHENSGWATQSKIMSITTQAIGASDASKALALFKANGAKYQQEIDADKAEGTSFGVQGTPGTIIGNQLISGAQPYSAFKSAIDAQLSGK